MLGLSTFLNIFSEDKSNLRTEGNFFQWKNILANVANWIERPASLPEIGQKRLTKQFLAKVANVLQGWSVECYLAPHRIAVNDSGEIILNWDLGTSDNLYARAIFSSLHPQTIKVECYSNRDLLEPSINMCYPSLREDKSQSPTTPILEIDSNSELSEIFVDGLVENMMRTNNHVVLVREKGGDDLFHIVSEDLITRLKELKFMVQ